MCITRSQSGLTVFAPTLLKAICILHDFLSRDKSPVDGHQIRRITTTLPFLDPSILQQTEELIPRIQMELKVGETIGEVGPPQRPVWRRVTGGTGTGTGTGVDAVMSYQLGSNCVDQNEPGKNRDDGV